MGFNFPNSPTPGQVYSPVGGYSYVFLDGVWRMVQPTQAYVPTAQTRNRIVNGAMQISQENGDTAVPTDGYPADQWVFMSTIATAQASRSRPSLFGNPQIGLGAPTPKPSLTAGDLIFFMQSIEGIRVSDFLWGSASAKQVVLRFNAYSEKVGTFSVFVQNSAADRSFVAQFTVAAATTWTTHTIVIPGDTTGVWTIDNGIGLFVGFCFAVGSTYHGVAGWQAGEKLALPSNSNGVATTGNSLYITNVGLYLDPNNTGVAPSYQMPDEAEELRACQRYWQTTGINWIVETAMVFQTSLLPTVMRANPAVTGGGAGFVNGSSDRYLAGYQTTRAYQTMNLNARM